jgi:hypothetical protein
MPKKEPLTTEEKHDMIHGTSSVTPSIHDLEWTDYVLSLLSEDEKISGNPTTDGLRRVFEVALNCKILSSKSSIVQSPEPNNEKRATVVHSIDYRLNDPSTEVLGLNIFSVDGAADVYWGNCDKLFRNHPVAVAETRAEGRALKRALRLRKVVAAEEIAKEIEDSPDNLTVGQISNQQINFIDVLAQRLNIDVIKLFKQNNLDSTNIYTVSHDSAISIIRLLSKYQTSADSIPVDIIGYSKDWK